MLSIHWRWKSTACDIACLLVALLSLACCGSAEAKQNPVERLGLTETTSRRALVEDAIRVANRIAGARNVHRFVGSWQPAPPEGAGQRPVQVYLLSTDSVSVVNSIFVPDDCGCVFIQPKALEAWIARHSTASPASMLEVAPGDIIAFMLLHELGHIEHGDPGQFGTVRDPRGLNVKRTEEKTREEKADNFAVDLLSATSADIGSLDGWLDAQRLQMALTKISWNLSVIRHLDNFGASVLCSRAVFQDSGYSHPNFELRILHANYRLTKLPEGLELIRSFETCRKNPQPVNLLDWRQN